MEKHFSSDVLCDVAEAVFKNNIFNFGKKTKQKKNILIFVKKKNKKKKKRQPLE